MKPRMVNRQQINKEVPQPVSMKTPKGGNMIAPMNLKISEQILNSFTWLYIRLKKELIILK
ncbi:hypothetical protein DAHU10_021560 [Hanseniaspora uvarum]|nr:hypothetical protein DAHU10_021560 [Hanseniaspora uvarum]